MLYLSNTSISMFYTCKRKFKYRYIDKIKPSEIVTNKYLSFGMSIHKALAKFNTLTDEQIRTLQNLHTLLRSSWIRDGYKDIEEERKFGLKALDILTNYFNNPLDTGTKTVLIEKNIQKNMDNKFILCGVIDKGFINIGGELEVTDYKVGNKIYHSEDFQIDPQLPIYVLLAEEFLGTYPSVVSYYYLAHNMKFERKITENNIREIIDSLWNVYELIDNEKEFLPSPTPYCSNSCEYADRCEASRDESLMVMRELEKFDNSFVDF